MKVVCFDLDDTLYKEVDFLESAFREISGYAFGLCDGGISGDSSADAAYDVMLAAWRDGGNAFRALNDYLKLSVPLEIYLKMYRDHKPCVTLDEDVAAGLEGLVAGGCVIGLISDGRSGQQRRKIAALGLERYIGGEDILISEEFGSEKPSEGNFHYFMNRYGRTSDFVYVGDNPEKDFVTPNRLGWLTICLKDNGRNIHRQDFDAVPPEALPAVTVDTLRGIMEIISHHNEHES